jgi:AcrR family transcriptional regulator
MTGEPADGTGRRGEPATSDGLRADARHNRDRILRAAREAFTSQGIDVPMTTIARRAGVGVATLYRRFPTRTSLVTEAFAEQVGVCVAALDDALLDPDPWRGFCTVITKLCALQATDRGFTAAFLMQFPDVVDYDRERRRAEAGFAELVQRAKNTGQLREDFTPADLTLLLLANNGLVAGTRQESLAASRRLVAYLLQAFQADHTAPLPPPVALPLHAGPSTLE